MDLSGKTVIITGGNSGLGLECARHIARMMGKGPKAGRLIIACRNVEKGTRALACASFSLTNHGPYSHLTFLLQPFVRQLDTREERPGIST